MARVPRIGRTVERRDDLATLCEKLEVPETFTMDMRLYKPRPLPDGEQRVGQLSEQAQRDIQMLRYPEQAFPYRRQPGVLQVAIVGAGQAGMLVAFSLMRYGIEAIRVLDKRAFGQQGPWRTYARNHVLRTRKNSTGNMECGVPSLHFQRWATARYGAEYYERMEYIPVPVWADYLDWYARATRLPIEYEVCVNEVRWNGESRHFELSTNQGTVRAEFVVMCMGQESAGEVKCPPEVVAALPRSAYAHTMEPIDTESFARRDVVIIGGGASAFDIANVALAAGAKSVDMMIRRKALPSKHIYCWGARWLGFHRHYPELPDELKWSYSLADMHNGVPPPRDTYFEAVRDERFRLFGAAPIDSLEYRDGRILGRYGGNEFSHDFMVCGTANRTYISGQPELQSIIPAVKLWRDVFKPADGRTHPALEGSPYLGPAMQFEPKDEKDWHVRRIHFLGSGGHGASRLSGYRCHLSGMQFIAPAICHEISRHLFLDHCHDVKAAFDEYGDWDE
jgi:FAD-dependent urate hydroxylase